jgi:hypothetical protein
MRLTALGAGPSLVVHACRSNSGDGDGVALGCSTTINALADSSYASNAAHAQRVAREQEVHSASLWRRRCCASSSSRSSKLDGFPSHPFMHTCKPRQSAHADVWLARALHISCRPRAYWRASSVVGSSAAEAAAGSGAGSGAGASKLYCMGTARCPVRRDAAWRTCTHLYHFHMHASEAPLCPLPPRTLLFILHHPQTSATLACRPLVNYPLYI